MPRTVTPATERLWRRVDRSGGPNACWPWTGPVDRRGYGRIWSEGQKRSVHAVAYEARNGALRLDESGRRPDVDHQCHNRSDCRGGPSCLHRRCCNPEHLRLVTRGENTLAGKSISAANARKEACDHGHAYAEANTYRRSDGTRDCKACRAAAQRARRRRRNPNGKRGKLTPDTVAEIRQLHAQGRTYTDLAREFGLHAVHVGRIIRREVWR
jgi:hypothetical protein